MVTIGKLGYRANNVSQPEIVLASGDQKLTSGVMGMENDVQSHVAAVLRRAACGG